MAHLKYALRQLRLRPALSVIVIVMLALGIGATTAMFSLFYHVLVQRLPVPEPERLVKLEAPGLKPGQVRAGSAVADRDAAFSYPMFRDLESRQSVLSGVAAHIDFQANLAYRGQTLAGQGVLVSGSYFGVLNLEPAVGRLIGPQDAPRVGESDVAVLSYDFWQNQFGGDAGIIDRTLVVNGRPLTVIGVAPMGFSGAMLGWRPQVFVPITLRWLMQPEARPDQEDRFSYWLYLFGRLSSGVTLDQARAQMNVLYSGILNEVEAPAARGLSEGELERFRARRLLVEPGGRGQSVLHRPAAQPLWLLFGVTALVLLIVCVNIAHLLLARGASRASEMAIRTSVGASRAGLLAQLLIESAVLAAVGGIASLPVAALTLDAISAMIPARFAAGLVVDLSSAAVWFTAGASLATVLLFGLAPAWQTSAANPLQVIKGQAQQSTGGRGMARFRSLLSTAQIAVSLLLLILAGLFIRSLANISRVDLGIEADSLVSFAVSPGLNGYSGDRAANLYDAIEARLVAQPGITDAGSSIVTQIGLAAWTFPISVEGFEAGAGTDATAGANFVSQGYLDTLSIPLLAGRGFTEADTRDSPRVAIVNQSFVRKFSLGDHALGTRIGVGSNAETNFEIVGVVADAKYGQVKNNVPAQVFQLWRQTGGSPWLNFYVRGNIGSDALMRTIPRVVSELDPNLPVSNLVTGQGQVRSTIFLDRLITLLSASFAGLATLLAALGLYGVLAYNVARRTRELGLRLALGADPNSLRALVLRQVGRMALVGVVVGLVLALGVGRIAEALLFGLSGSDPVVILAALAVLAMVVFAASYLPARRASRIAPMEALRYE